MKRTIVSFALFFFVALFAYAEDVPHQINCQGYVTSGGTAFSGTGYFKFKIVNASGTGLGWSNDGTHTTDSTEPAAATSTTCSSSVFNIALGDTNLSNMTAIPTTIFNTYSAAYLRVWFSTNNTTFEQLSPDKRITSSAYAYNAYAAYTVESATQSAVKLGPFNTASGNTGEIRFLELAAGGSNYVGFKAPDSIDPDCVWTLPSADGTSGQILKTDGGGVLSWATQSSDASTTLSNLTDTVAINKSLIAGGVEATHDLGSSGISWRDIYTRTVKFDGSSSGTTTVQATAAAGTTTLILPAATDTLVGKATADTLTNKTLTSPVINGGAIDGTIIGATTPAEGTFTTATAKTSVKLEDPGAGTNTVTMQAPALAVDYSLTFPSALPDPDPIAFLKISDAGVMTTDTTTYIISGDALLANGSIPLTHDWAMGAFSLTGGVGATFTGTVSAEQLTSTHDAAITNLLTVPNINGSTDADDDITIQGTSSGTKTTSYVNLQPTGGNVGIGTTTPGAKLHAVTDDDVTSLVTEVARITHSTTTAAAGIGTALTLYSEDASGNIDEAGRIQAVFPIAAHDTQTGRVDITALVSTPGIGLSVLNSGNVGIGTTSPTANFQVAQGTIGPGTVGITSGSATVTGTGTQFSNTFKVEDTITVSGQTVRTISTITNDTSLTVTASFSTTASGLTYTLTGGTRLVVLGNGNVGIGTTTPNNLLQVANYIDFEDVHHRTWLGYAVGGGNTGLNNTFIGYAAGCNSGTGANNTYMGMCAGYGDSANASYNNTYIGQDAGHNNSTYPRRDNTFIGMAAGLHNNTSYNTCIGNQGWQTIATCTGGYNTFIGPEAGRYTTSGGYNVFVGNNAGNANTTGERNTFIGYQVGYYNATGKNNTFIGYNAGSNITYGSNNIAIGYFSYPPSATGSNQMSIGNMIYATGVNGTGTTVSTGNVGIGTTAPTANLTVAQGTVGIGTVYFSSGGVTITGTAGTGTQFLNTFKVGDTITMTWYSGGSQTATRTISAVTSDTLLTVTATMPSAGTATYTFTGGNRLAVLGNGNVGIGTTTPSAYLHLKAGTATAGTAPLKFTAGTNLTTAEAGAMEYAGTSLYFTPTGTTRKIIACVATPQTLGAGDTFAVTTSNVIIITGYALENPIATITGGVSGQELTLIFVDGLVKITDNNDHIPADTIDLSDAADFTSADDTVLKLVRDGTSWYEVSRSVN